MFTCPLHNWASHESPCPACRIETSSTDFVINSGPPDCSRHSKQVAGISDMKLLAEAIAELHYEQLSILLYHLREKLWADGQKDVKANRPKLGERLMKASTRIGQARVHIQTAWKISKPFMKQ